MWHDTFQPLTAYQTPIQKLFDRMSELEANLCEIQYAPGAPGLRARVVLDQWWHWFDKTEEGRSVKEAVFPELATKLGVPNQQNI